MCVNRTLFFTSAVWHVKLYEGHSRRRSQLYVFQMQEFEEWPLVGFVMKAVCPTVRMKNWLFTSWIWCRSKNLSALTFTVLECCKSPRVRHIFIALCVHICLAPADRHGFVINPCHSVVNKRLPLSVSQCLIVCCRKTPAPDSQPVHICALLLSFSAALLYLLLSSLSSLLLLWTTNCINW